MECQVCLQKTDKVKRKLVTCEDCEYQCCKVCITNYMNTLHVPLDCMNCHAEWNQLFLSKNITKAFVKGEYKEHLRNIYYEREMSTLSNCIPYMESEKNVIKIQKEFADNRKAIKELQEKNRDLLENLRNEKAFLSGQSNSATPLQPEKTIDIRGRCPKQNCNGFVTRNWSCVTCDTKVCKSCMEEKLDDHECNEDTVQSIQDIRNNTKLCPNCKVRVFRIEGCSQMWCTHCNTAFDWTTGNVIRNIRFFHNPHYIEYQRNRMDEDIFSKINRTTFDRTFKNRLVIIIRHINHTRDYIEVHDTERSTEILIRKYKIKYIRNQITSDILKLKLEQLSSKKIFSNECNKIIVNFCNQIEKIIQSNLTTKYGEAADKQNLIDHLIDETDHKYFYMYNVVRSSFNKQKNKFNNMLEVVGILPDEN